MSLKAVWNHNFLVLLCSRDYTEGGRITMLESNTVAVLPSTRGMGGVLHRAYMIMFPL